MNTYEEVLRAKLFILEAEIEAEIEAREGYTLNTDMQLECRVLRKCKEKIKLELGVLT